MATREEDPFASLINLCKPTHSQELKLANCPFTRDSQSFSPMDSDSDDGCNSDLETSASPPTQSQGTATQALGTGIITLTLPHTDSEEETENNASENEVFQTPPEHHNRRSSSSSQELLSQPDILIAGTTEVLEETARINDVVRLGGEGETLGFSSREGLDGYDSVSRDQRENVEEVEKIAGVDTELKRHKVFEDKVGEPMYKKIRVSGENLYCDSLFADETGVTEKGEDSQNSPYVGPDAVPQERMVEKALEEDTVDQFPNVDCETEKIEDTEKLNNCSFDGGVVEKEKADGNRLIDNVGLSEKASPEKARDDVPDATRKDGERPSGSKPAEDGAEVEKPKNIEPKELSFLEMLDAVEKLLNLKKVDGSPKETDFLEIAKRLGMTFRKPRWR